MSLGYTIPPKYWDERNTKVKTNCPVVQNTTKLNNLLVKQKTAAVEAVMQLQDSGKLGTMSLKEIRNHILGKEQTSGLYSFAEQVIAEMKSMDKVGNARVYETVLRSIKHFAGEKDFPFQQITFSWLKKYEAWYLSRKNSKGKPNTTNGLSVHLRTLRALYNRAIKSKIVPRDNYPFDDYRIKSQKTRKRAISEVDINKIKEVVPQTSRQERAKDYFLMSFYLMGASFIDLAFLTRDNIKNGRIEYRRKKTGQLHDIKIALPLQILIDKYLENKLSDYPYIVNVVKGDTEEQRYTAARDELRRYNRALKELAKIAGIEGEVTSYTARHSFATIAKYKGVPVAVISEALGHESPDVTQVYLDSFDKSVLDKYN